MHQFISQQHLLNSLVHLSLSLLLNHSCSHLPPTSLVSQLSSFSSPNRTMSINPFFKGFPGFDHDPTAGICAEFQRLSQHRKWKQGSKKWRKNWDACMNAEYERLIGIRVTSLATWQQICKKLGLKGLFTSITKCKKVRWLYLDSETD